MLQLARLGYATVLSNIEWCDIETYEYCIYDFGICNFANLDSDIFKFLTYEFAMCKLARCECVINMF